MRSLEMPRAKCLTWGYGIASGCTALERASFPLLTNLCATAFDKCTSLVTLEVPNVKTVGDWALRNCAKLAEFANTNVQSVGKFAFAGCSLITNIVLGAGCSTNYGEGAYSSRFVTSPKLASLSPMPSFLNATDELLKKSPLVGCAALTNSDIVITGSPALTTIPENFLYDCRKVSNVHVRVSTRVTVEGSAFRGLAPSANVWWRGPAPSAVIENGFFSSGRNKENNQWGPLMRLRIRNGDELDRWKELVSVKKTGEPLPRTAFSPKTEADVQVPGFPEPSRRVHGLIFGQHNADYQVWLMDWPDGGMSIVLR